ncbi:MAG TPA: AMP-binding protein [Acidimicrobiia bacterium]|jgi:crotonobetaine/carnitine-CoA ligase
MLDPTCLAPHAVALGAATTPDAVALEHVDGARLTYAELDRRARAWAGALAARGVAEGDHVATMLPNTFDAHLTMLALAWLRVVEVPLNVAFTGRMLAYALDHADVTTLVVAPEFRGAVAAVEADAPKLARIIELDDATRASLDEGVDDGAPSERVGPQYRDVHSLMFTSGTTGPSKAVITPWAVMYQFWSWVPDDALVAGDGLYCPMPLFHNSGRSAFNYAMARKARFVLRDRFSASDFWSDIRATGCVTAALVGPMTALLHAAPPRDDDADTPLRNAILGPMTSEIDDFERRFGVRVATGYGQTETGMAVTTGWDHGPWANCGRIREDYPWPEVRIADEFDEPVPDGEVGELLVRSAEPWALNVGYHKMPDQTAAAWRNGWFHTGDAFRRDADGWFYFVDRLRDTIRRRGENISSFEVETLVAEHPAVRECAAIGVPAPLGEDDVFVAVIVDDAATFQPAELLEFLASRMPRFMLPRYVEVVDDLPRTEASMRVRKHELRNQGVTASTWDRTSSS